MKYYIYQEEEKGGFLTLKEEVERVKVTKADKTILTEQYGNFSRYIYCGWNNTSKDIIGWLYLKPLSPLRKVKTYIFKIKL